MKTSAKYLLVFLSAALLTAGKPIGDSEKELRKIIEPLNKKFANAILEDELENFLSCYTEDAILMIPFLPSIKGKHALTVHWHNNMAKGELVESVDISTLDIWASGNMIYERGSYQITFKKFKNKPRAVYGSYFSIWEKQVDGTYKMKYDISNLNHKV